MKTTKLITALIFILAILTISVSSFAQDKDSKPKKTPEERATLITDKMKSSLNLTDDQYTKIYALNLQRIKERRALKEEKSKTDSDIKKKRSEYMTSLKSILTDEQYQTLKKMREEKKSKNGQKDKSKYKSKD
jgi:periplasmic protein CpxP/Spy